MPFDEHSGLTRILPEDSAVVRWWRAGMVNAAVQSLDPAAGGPMDATDAAASCATLPIARRDRIEGDNEL